jgi:hypothetical protein
MVTGFQRLGAGHRTAPTLTQAECAIIAGQADSIDTLTKDFVALYGENRVTPSSRLAYHFCLPLLATWPPASSAESRIMAEIQILLGSEVGSAVKSVLFNSQRPAAGILSTVTGLVVFMVAPPASSAKFAQRSIGFGTFRRKLAPASSVLSKIASFPSVCCWPSAACSCFHCS